MAWGGAGWCPSWGVCLVLVNPWELGSRLRSPLRGRA